MEKFGLELDDLHHQLGWLLLSKGWTDVLKPAVSEKVKTLYVRLLDPSTQRQDKLPDDFVRGQIAAFKWLLEWPEKEMQAAARALKEAEEQAKQKEVEHV